MSWATGSLRSARNLNLMMGCFMVIRFSCSVVSYCLQTQGLQHARLPKVSPRVCSNSCPLSRWCHPAISSSVTLFSFCFQSLPASGSFPMSWLFASGGQSIGTPDFSIRPSNEYSGLISFKSDWFCLLAVQGTFKSFSSTTVQKHQFFGAQPTLWSSCHICIWLLEKP